MVYRTREPGTKVSLYILTVHAIPITDTLCREADDVVLRLVMRQPGSTLALPRDGADTLPKTDDIPWYFAAEVTDFARVMKGSEDYMLEQFDEEISALEKQQQEDEIMFGEETEWTKKAIRAINDAKEKVQGIGNPPELHQLPTEKRPKRELIQFSDPNDAPEMYHILHAQKSGVSTPLTPGVAQVVTADGVPIPVSSQTDKSLAEGAPALLNSTSHAHHPDAPFFFYQALLHYYLAPLDIRILKAAFGSFSQFPSTVLPRVEHVSTGHIVDDDLRKRMKYLSHLPYGCEVGFLECNWTGVVLPEVLDKFQADIDKRRKRHMEKETREEKDRVRNVMCFIDHQRNVFYILLPNLY
jgi:hypothetical protein